MKKRFVIVALKNIAGSDEVNQKKIICNRKYR